MNLDQIIIPTATAGPGMTVEELFTECVRAEVPGIPFHDAAGRIVGLVTIKHCLKRSCLPEYVVELANVLGPQLSCLKNAEKKAREVLGHSIDDYVLRPIRSITSDSPIMKALAIMEKNDCSFLFIIDEEGYRGVVTIQGIARRMLELREGDAGACMQR